MASSRMTSFLAHYSSHKRPAPRSSIPPNRNAEPGQLTAGLTSWVKDTSLPGGGYHGVRAVHPTLDEPYCARRADDGALERPLNPGRLQESQSWARWQDDGNASQGG